MRIGAAVSSGRRRLRRREVEPNTRAPETVDRDLVDRGSVGDHV